MGDSVPAIINLLTSSSTDAGEALRGHVWLHLRRDGHVSVLIT